MDNKIRFDDISIEIFNSYKNIKAIIFDFDDTLYRNLSWKGYDEFFLKSIRKFFLDLSDAQFEKLLKIEGFSPERPAETLAGILIKEKGNAKELVEFLKTVRFETDWENAKVFSNALLKELAKRSKLYIVSNSAKQNIEFVSKKIGLDISMFTRILSNKFEKEDLSKSRLLKDILEFENIEPKNVLMVGDSIKYDIEPAKKLGLQTLLIFE